jgi:hypothetical protein
MNMGLGAKSLALFVISVLFLILITLFEASLSGMSLTAEKILSALLLVVPAVIGIVLGVLAINRKEPKRWMAISGILLNTLFALFQIFVISFAG